MDYLIDFRVLRYLRDHGGTASLDELTRGLQVTDVEVVDALIRLVAAGQITRSPLPVKPPATERCP